MHSLIITRAKSFKDESRRTLAFSCGARSAFKLKEQDYLRNMLSRRQLQGFVRQRPCATTTKTHKRLMPSKGR
jgi:hypothetical protein